MTEPGFEPLFDGVSLTGWSAIPRQYGRLYPDGPDVLDVLSHFPRDYQEHADANPAAWSVEDGVIVGRQQPEGSGYGGYLISDRDYGDFELRLEANPDWPADTGVMLRRCRDSWAGLQVLIDHRQQWNRARCVVCDTADDDLILVEVVAVDLDTEFFTGLKP